MSPLKINAQTGEPYLQLPAPHTNIIVTPPRRSDASAIVNILGDQQLSLLLRRPPHPYLPKHAEEWLDQVTAWSDSARRELEKVGCEGTLSSCPVRSIREVKADGSDVYLGDIELRKSLFDSVTDEVERKLLRDENEAREKGDARIIWEIGYYITPSHQSRGIVTLACRVLLQLGVARMGIRVVRAEVLELEAYVASRRILEKLGFMKQTVYEGCFRGEKKAMVVLERRWSDDDSSDQ